MPPFMPGMPMPSMPGFPPGMFPPMMGMRPPPGMPGLFTQYLHNVYVINVDLTYSVLFDNLLHVKILLDSDISD